jgi:RNA polymerase sigma-70 factor (ECF subfamily)
MDLNINEIYTKNKDKTIEYIFKRINNIEVSKELCNDIFYKVYKNINKFDKDKGNFLVWLYEITNNTIIDYLRKRKFETIDCNNVSLFDNNNFENNFEYKDINNKIIIAINNIPNVNMKKIAKLYFIHELTYEEISKALNIPLGSVKGNIHRIKEQIKQYLNVNYKIKNL